MKKSNRIELKKELCSSIEKDVIAFLNYKEGGIIYIGIDTETGKAVTVKEIGEKQIQIKERLKNNISPSILGLFDVIIEKKDNINIIKIIIAAGNERPYYLKKQGMSSEGCYIREDAKSQPMPTKMIEELFAKRTRNSLGKIESPKNKLTFEQLKIYYNSKGTNLKANFASNLELLTKTGEFNYVAYLLSDKNSTSIKVAKYAGTNRIDLIENNEFGFCSLLKSTKQTLDKLDVENRTFTKITPKQRDEKKMFNAIALREAVVNAIVHNDYTNEVPPKFELFEDRIEITSTGGLPIGFSEEEFFSGYSFPRNKELMRIFKDLKFVEHLGSGIPRILEKYSKSAFKITDNFLKITLPVELSKNELKNAKKKTYKADNKIMDAILDNKYITIKEIMKKTSLSKGTVQWQITKLKEKGVIERKGSNKMGYWNVLKT